MKKFRVPVKYVAQGEIEVEGSSVEDVIKKVKSKDFCLDIKEVGYKGFVIGTHRVDLGTFIAMHRDEEELGDSMTSRG